MAKITREIKETMVGDMEERLKNAKAVVFADYRGMTVAESAELRDKLKEAGSDFKVIKQTLFKRASKNVGMELDEGLYKDRPLALAFAPDEVAAAKIVQGFAKTHEKPEILGGLLSGEIVDAAGMKQLALLPSREELLAKALASMQAPVSNFVGVLRATCSSLVYALSAIKEQKAA